MGLLLDRQWEGPQVGQTQGVRRGGAQLLHQILSAKKVLFGRQSVKAQGPELEKQSAETPDKVEGL